MTTPITSKSCFGCPSYLSANQAGSFFGKSTGAPMCARYGSILGSPKQQPDELTKVAEENAEKCSSYGHPRPNAALSFNTYVTTAHPASLMEPLPTEQEKSLVPSCLQCKHYVDEGQVVNGLGFVGGLCGFTGRLLLSDRLSAEAQQCLARKPGQKHEGPLNYMPLLPQFATSGPVNITSDASYTITPSDEIIEPLDWETEKPVSDGDTKAGIKAWRKISHPNSPKKFVFLPIYEPDHFTEAERKLIPKTGDDEHPELYMDHGGFIYRVAACWAGLDETPALWGRAGTGKTELFRHMAWLMQVPFRRISITASSEVDDLIGKVQYSTDRGTFFVYGRLVDGWRSPGVLCLDEPNVGPPEVWQAIRPLTDNSKQLVIDQNEGERIDRNVDCYLGMAMNPAWDIVNVGTQQIGDADGSRLMHVFMQLPPEPVERHIIRERCKVDGYEIDDSDLDAIMKIAVDIRNLSNEGTLPLTWGVRNQIKVARATQYFDLMDAYKMGVLDMLEPEIGQTIKDILVGYNQQKDITF